MSHTNSSMMFQLDLDLLMILYGLLNKKGGAGPEKILMLG